MNSEKKKAPLIVILAAVVGSIIGSVVVRQIFDRPPTAEKVLVQTSSQLNKSLPMMVDQVTRLDSTFPGPGKQLNYKYTLVGIKTADLDLKQIKDSIQPTLFQNYKTHPSMKNLRDMPAILKYHYFNEAGAFLFDIEIDPAKF